MKTRLMADDWPSSPVNQVDQITAGSVMFAGVNKTMVTHDVGEAVYLSDRIVIMDRDPGRISEIVAVPFAKPRTRLDPDVVALTERIVERLAKALA